MSSNRTAGLRLILADVAEVIEDQAVEPVELGEGRRQGEIAPGGLQSSARDRWCG